MRFEQVPPALLEKLWRAIQPIIEMEVQRRLGTLTLRMKNKSRDGEMMQLCKRVADAVDELEAAKFTSAEIPARKKLTAAASALRNAIKRREARR
jgi:hypothetical protein